MGAICEDGDRWTRRGQGVASQYSRKVRALSRSETSVSRTAYVINWRRNHETLGRVAIRVQGVAFPGDFTLPSHTTICTSSSLFILLFYLRISVAFSHHPSGDFRVSYIGPEGPNSSTCWLWDIPSSWVSANLLCDGAFIRTLASSCRLSVGV